VPFGERKEKIEISSLDKNISAPESFKQVFAWKVIPES
jgi:hypothetical protein